MHTRTLGAALLGAASLALAALPAGAQSGDSHAADGLWLSADQGAIIEFKECSDSPGALCGQIVWDKDAGTSDDACGVRIAKLKKWDGQAWREGWVHDPRSKKNYKGVLRAQGERLNLRAYIGTEILGETEEMTRTAARPNMCPQTVGQGGKA
ncbi:DUF2147 domain-containing protein [Acidovorax sp. HDW3]|uniref:DUF2147 domain-containing protein n=1 Tax=Acidovorax sp. HDW3 TaxID=2714923 RepID=UPI00140734D3|nr:DUF2147 domain-containing protein [Acidovorax sp. HDW3]QIL43256.1 DUF2147 domain-containing protein [Acidovorax sp. HDW3]